MKFNLDLKNKFKQKKSFRIISIVLVAVIIIGGFLTWYLMSREAGTKIEKVYAKVTRGTVTNVIEGTGTVQAISQYDITSLAKGDVIADYFEVGDYVKKDQLLYEIDSASIDKSITRQKSNVEKAATNYNDALENVANLNVRSTINGVISNMYVSVGDNVQQGSKIADVINKDTLEITLPFGKYDARNIQAGNSASVTLSKSLTTIPATVTRVATGAYVNDYGVEVTDVEIEFANPGTISEGETASAVVGNYACYDTSAVSYIATKTITAKSSGEVQIMYKHKGDEVKNGESIVLLESSSVTRSRKDAQTSLQDANLSLDDLYDNLEDYSIKSPIDGKVIQKNIKAGEKLDSNASSAMAIIADLSKLTFDMSIDELDISKISAGQEVSITADALPNQKFTGYVSNISIVGSAYQGVTSYPVTVTIENTADGDLIPGMNVSAQIIVDSAENVLRVPVSAIQMGNLVIVKDDGTFADPSEMMQKIAQQRMSEMQKNATKQQTEKSNQTGANKNPSSVNDGNMPQRTQMPQGEQRPQGEGYYQRGQMPQMGEMPQRGEMPQMGEMPQKGEMPQMGGNSKENTSDAQQTTGAKPPVADAVKPSAEKSEESKTTSEKKNDNKSEKNDAASKDSKTSGGQNSKNNDAADKSADRIKTMIENLDVPAGYTVVMVQTGLTDGTYIEVKEIEGSLKEGDEIVLSAVTQAASGTGMFGAGGMSGGMRSGMGGMPSGMGGMNGGMRTGMGGMPSGMGGMSGNRSTSGANRSGMR